MISALRIDATITSRNIYMSINQATEMAITGGSVNDFE
jgi:hypothetical protein